MITSFILEWYDWSCHCVDDVSWTRLTVYRNKALVVYEEFDGRDNILKKQEEKQIPKDIDYQKVPNLASEARQKLENIRNGLL